MKKILFILDEFYPITSAPGVRIKSFLDEFKDYPVFLLGGAESRPQKFQKFDFIFLPVKRPNEKRLVSFIVFLLKINVLSIIRAIKIKPHVAIVSIPKYELLLSLPLLRLSGAKIILDIRDSGKFINYSAYFNHFFPSPASALLGRIVKFFVSKLLQFCLSSSHMITVANEGIYSSLGKHQYKSRIISNGVDTELFHPRRKKRKEKLEKSSRKLKKLNLVYIGNFSEKDNFQIFSGLEKKHKENLCLHLIGEGRNCQKIVEYLTRGGLNLKLYGRVIHQLLPEILIQMDAGFIFRDKEVTESIPVAVYEFCAMGLPTISNNVGIMSQFIKKNRLGEIVNDAQELNLLINRMIVRPQTNALYLRNKAVKKFSRKKQAQLFKREVEILLSI